MIKTNTVFLIVGLGLIGGSYAKGLKVRGYTVNAIDSNTDTISYAIANNVIDHGVTENYSSLIQQADIIIMGLYPQAMVEWLRLHQNSMRSGTLITDVSGIKASVIGEINVFLRSDVEFIAAHPMAGKEVSGVAYSDEKMFLSANLIITPTENNSLEAIDTIRDLGNILRFERISLLSPKKHDEMIGFLSQLTHVIAVCLMNCHESEHLIAYTGDSFRDLTRIAKINEELWTELFLLNKEILLQEIDVFMDEMNRFRSILLEENVDLMKQRFKQSTSRRKAFDK